METDSSDYLVIGSGPASIAAVMALVNHGHHVTILDVGTTLDPKRKGVVDRMAQLNPEDWTEDDIATLGGQREQQSEAVHSKRSYGSSFPFATPNALRIDWRSSGKFNHSLAKGGLSNVWGASLLSNRQQDIEDWPITIQDLAPHYREVMKFVPSTAILDDLDEFLPTYSIQSNPLKPSVQGSRLLSDLDKERSVLVRSGIRYGRGRLAIQANGEGKPRPCVYCALCLEGCPYGLIYSSTDTLAGLIAAQKVRYLSDRLVETFQSDGERVVVVGHNTSDGTRFSFSAKRLFLGAGVLPTALICLNSIGTGTGRATLRDSQYFIYPMLRFCGVSGIETERMHTSTQVFIEINDPSVSRHTVHLQIYGYSRFLHDELERTFLRWPLRFAFFRKYFLGRLMIAQGFLHSSESGHVDLDLKHTPDGKCFLEADAVCNPTAFRRILKIGWKLARNALKLRMFPLFPGLQIPSPGSGYHSGGSFPMRENPAQLETDTFGRFPGHDRVHIIDSSVLPSVPATSITMTTMANAHRIATKASSLPI